MAVFWDVVPCSLVDIDLRFRGVYCLHHQGDDGHIYKLCVYIQGDRKVMQPILKYILMVAIQYNSIGLIKTQYRCDYTRAHAGHVMLQPACASPSVVFKESKDVFSQVQWVFIVEHYVASRRYLTCQYVFRDTFSDSPEPNKSTLSRLQKLFIGLHETWGKEWMHASLNAVDISNTWYNIVFVFWF
jgi:hypothetical protein